MTCTIYSEPQSSSCRWCGFITCGWTGAASDFWVHLPSGSKETGRAGSSDPKRSEGLEVENLGQLRHTATKLSKYVTHFEEDWFWTMNGKNSLQLIHDLNSRSIRHWQHRVTFTIVSFLCLVFFRMLCGRLQKFRCGAAAPCWQLDANASNWRLVQRVAGMITLWNGMRNSFNFALTNFEGN